MDDVDRGPEDGGRDPARAARDRATAVACFATVLYLALVVCAFGFVSLLADVDVVSVAGTGALVGSAMLAAAVLAVGVALVRDARRRGPRERRPRAWPFVVGLAAGAAYVLSGAALVALEERSWFGGVLFASATLTSAFPYLVVVLAAVVALADVAVADARPGGAARWPWEREEGE